MFKFSNNNFNLYLLTESRKSEAIDKFMMDWKGTSREPGTAKTIEAFKKLDELEKPDPRVGNRRFVDKYPTMVLNFLFPYVAGKDSIETGIPRCQKLLERIASVYQIMTPEERGMIGDKIGFNSIHKLLDEVEFRVVGKVKKDYDEKLKEAIEYQKDGQGKVLFNDPEKLILVFRAYTHKASCTLGYAAWCTANPNNDHSFYEYQEETQSGAKVYYIHLFKSNIRKAKFAKFAVEVLKDGGVLIFDRDDESYGTRKFLNELAEGQDLYNVTPKEMEELIDKIYTFAETDRYINPKAKLSEIKRRPYRLKIRYN